jgi:hypothetical protein
MSVDPESLGVARLSGAERVLPVRATEEQGLLDRVVEEQQRNAARYMPTLTVKQFSEREHMLRELKALLVEGIDYGKIPGAGDKPVLLKPGAEKLCAFFGYAPHYTAEVIEDWDGKLYGEALFYYKYTCLLSKDGKPVGEGQGSCNSWETKYRYRVQKRVCPACGQPALIEGKQWKPDQPREWVCYEKKGGCKTKFAIDDKRITEQAAGMIKNPDFADLINTIQKMGQKRAMVAAVLSATGASQYFTQDLEDGERGPDPAAGIDTGGQPVGTQAAANAVRDRKLAAHQNTPTTKPGSGDGKTGPERSTGNDVKSQATPAAVPTNIVDPQVVAIWNRMGADKSKQMEEIDKLYDSFVPLIGEDAASSEYKVLAMKYGGADVFAKPEFTRRVVLELWKRIEEIKATVVKPGTEAPPDGMRFKPEDEYPD